MTQEEILEYNKRCAECLGWETEDADEDSCTYDTPYLINVSESEDWEASMDDYTNHLKIDEMLFHSDWNWIMEVVEAIKQLGYFVMINKWTSVYTGEEKEGNRIQITTVEGENTKVNTVQAINQFLIWYNENKQDNEHTRKF